MGYDKFSLHASASFESLVLYTEPVYHQRRWLVTEVYGLRTGC